VALSAKKPCASHFGDAPASLVLRLPLNPSFLSRHRDPKSSSTGHSWPPNRTFRLFSTLIFIKKARSAFLFYKFYKFREESLFIFNSLYSFVLVMGTLLLVMGTLLLVMGTLLLVMGTLLLVDGTSLTSN